MNPDEIPIYGNAFSVYVGDNRLLVRSVVDGLIYLVPANDLLITPKFATSGIFEPDVTKFMLKNIKPTDNCLDVGANFGYYTCLMARRANKGRVIGVEADPTIAALTGDNISINWLERNSLVLNYAVSEKAGSLELYRRCKRPGNTSIIKLDEDALNKMNEQQSESFKVECCTIKHLIDSNFNGRVDFIKIDVEGAEPLVFSGAEDVFLKNPHVKIVMEWAPAQISAAGFSIGNFVSTLESMNLSFSIIDYEGNASEVMAKDLLGVHYSNLFLKYNL